MSLVDEGLLCIEDPVGGWPPELAHPRVLRQVEGSLDDTVPAQRPITVRDLVTFTFGCEMAPEKFMAPDLRRGHLTCTRAHRLRPGLHCRRPSE